jgi:hypothetical protein
MPAGDRINYRNVHKYMASIGARQFGTDLKTHLERAMKSDVSERGRERVAAFAITDKLFVSPAARDFHIRGVLRVGA